LIFRAFERFIFFTHCTKANLSDDAGLIEMLAHNIDYFKSKPLKEGRQNFEVTSKFCTVWSRILRELLTTQPQRLIFVLLG
jgi:hypothetical protein